MKTYNTPTKIAKYRDPDHPGMWWLTDFTMEQVEGRLECLEVMVKNLQYALMADGHDEDCPVVHGASMDCAGGIPCEGLKKGR